jgi:hypothetical protein
MNETIEELKEMNLKICILQENNIETKGST